MHRHFRPRKLVPLFFCVAALFTYPVFAGQPLPDSAYAGSQRLVKNGSGTRSILWMSFYRCALYLPRRSNSLSEIMNPDAPKAVIVEALIDEEVDEIPSPWRGVLRDELSERAFRAMKQEVRKVKKFERFSFRYVPGQGTFVSVDGERVVRDKGFGLMQSLLEQWLGKQPVSGALRSALLGSEN